MAKMQGPFVMLSVNTMATAKWRKLKAYSRVVYTRLLTRYKRNEGLNPDSLVRYSHKDLLADTGLPSTTVKRGIRQLKSEKMISVWMPGGRWHQETTYRLEPKYVDGLYSEERIKPEAT